jgi:diaminohydroxyphosphoribosylaminopyrimidine deaminase / 5-amino-6-(5-phosphoribosylamino)uracil reductase
MTSPACFMQRALDLAARGLYTSKPNPRVGCVIVRGDHIVGEGFHARAGEPHAEVHALAQAGELARGATVYVTLEPCAHFGRTPPCVQALIIAGVARVVVADGDPNPLVNGAGMARLRAAGISVDVGLLREQARVLNPGFISRHERGRPWVRLKIAQSLDGKIALADGRSQWITGEMARRDAQYFRASACAIVSGIGTVLHDDPAFDVRLDADIAVRAPRKIILDSALRLSPSAKLLRNGQTTIIHAPGAATQRVSALNDAGAVLRELKSKAGHVDLYELLAFLQQENVNEILLEAGATLNSAWLSCDLVDELLIYQAPKILGNVARSAFSIDASDNLQAAPRWKIIDQMIIGVDTRTRWQRC